MAEHPETPDPYKGVLRWAWHRAGEHRRRWWVGGVIFAAALALLAPYLKAPKHASHVTLLWYALSGIGIAVFVVLACSLGYALLVASYEQRNVLRSEARATVVSLEALQESIANTAVPDDHANELKAIAARFRTEVSGGRAVSVDHKFDVESFAAHFPEEMVSASEWNAAISARGQTIIDVIERTQREAHERGIVMPHYLGEHIAEVISNVTMRRAESNQLHFPFRFPWHDLPSAAGQRRALWWTDGPAVAVLILEDQNGNIVLDRREAIELVEGLFWDAQDWPETVRFAARDRTPGGWQDKQQPLIDSLDRIARRTFIRRGGGCPQCH